MTISNATTPSSITIPSPPVPLKRKDYPDVKYWFESEYKSAIADSGGDTDAVGEKRRPGRPTKESGPAVRPYLEDESSNPMAAEHLSAAAEKFRLLANALLDAGIAPPSWKKQMSDAYNFMHHGMKVAFIEFALCEGDWKGETYFTVKYGHWSHHRPSLGETISPGTRKRKRLDSVFRGLTKMEELDIPGMVSVSLHGLCNLSLS